MIFKKSRNYFKIKIKNQEKGRKEGIRINRRPGQSKKKPPKKNNSYILRFERRRKLKWAMPKAGRICDFCELLSVLCFAWKCSLFFVTNEEYNILLSAGINFVNICTWCTQNRYVKIKILVFRIFLKPKKDQPNVLWIGSILTHIQSLFD